MQLTSATQVIPNPVNPQIGENLWQMNYRQSIAIDDIMDTTTLCCNCDFFITQADIDANSGGFTITQPGNWCLGENIITSQPIIIADLPGVVFDLKGRTISSSVKGAVNLPTGIIDVTNSPGTIIKNGYLIGLDLTPPVDRRSGIRFSQSDGSIVQNVQAQFFATVDDPAVFEGNFAFFANFSNYVQFLDCFATGPFLAGFTIFGNNGFVKNCEASHFSGYVVPGPLTANGIGFWLQGNNNYATNCTSSGGDAQPTPSSSGSIGFLLQGNNNTVNECTALNHKLNAYPSLGVDSGSGFSVTGDNCQISNCNSAYNEGFGIINTGSNLLVCNNSIYNNNSNFNGTSDSDLCNLLCSDYISQNRLPYTITQPGVYCFTGILEETAGNAAIIIADDVEDVTINLEGYSLTRTSLINNQPLITIGNNCNSITILGGTLRGNDTPSNENVGISVANSSYKNITITELEFQKFNTAIHLGFGGNIVSIANCSFFDSLDVAITSSALSNISIESCDAYNNNGFIQAINCPNTSISACSIHGGANSADAHINCTDRCDNLTIADSTVTLCQNNGMSINTSNNVSITNVSSHYNGQHGIFCNGCFDLNLDSTLTTSNGIRGVTIDNCGNINVSNCISMRNATDGFGITNYITAILTNCTAMTNLVTGFYAYTGLAITIDSCTATGNINKGFHLDSDTQFANVIHCTVTENLEAGFLSADIGALVSSSPLSHRFHACHAVFNGVVPGATDYSQANTVGVIMLIPLAAPTSSVLATTPGLSIPFQPTPAGDFSTYL
jgi:hypothetical protein